VQVALIRDRLEQLDELDKRRDAVLKSLEERELLTDELKEKIETATSLPSYSGLTGISRKHSQ